MLYFRLVGIVIALRKTGVATVVHNCALCRVLPLPIFIFEVCVPS